VAQVSIQEQVLAAVDKSREEPIWFFEEILNIKTTPADKRRGQSWDIDPWQKELIESVADVWRHKVGIPTRYNHDGKGKITVRAMHGPGKTFGVAGIMHWFNWVFKGTIVCTAPKEKQLKTRLWPAFRKIRNRAGADYSSLIKVDASKITWCGDEDWAAHAETASEPENLAGYHDEHLLFIVDEASGVKEEMYPVIEGAVSTGYIVIVILIGNPTKNVGTFYSSHMKEKVSRYYHKIHVDLEKTNRVSRDWVKQMGEKYGVDSPIYHIRCLGNFAEGDKNQLIALQWILDSQDKEYLEDGSLPKLRISSDVSDGGQDETVIIVSKHYQSFKVFLRMYRFSFPSSIAPIETGKACIRLFKEWGGKKDGNDDIVIDAMGVGSGAAGYCMDKGYPIIAYKGGASSDDTTQWRNRRVQSYLSLRDDFRDGKIIIADDFCDQTDWDDFEAQLCCIKSRDGGTERVEDLMTKEQTVKESGKSPDMADSAAMQYATDYPTMGSMVHVPEVVGETEMSHYEGLDI